MRPKEVVIGSEEDGESYCSVVGFKATRSSDMEFISSLKPFDMLFADAEGF